MSRWNARSSNPIVAVLVVIVDVDAANHAKIDDANAILIFDDHVVDHPF